MSKVIIGIHGLGNKPSKDILEDWWKNAMLEGLDKLDRRYELPKFELVYWADILYDKPLDENIKDADDPYFIDEKYFPGRNDFEVEDHSVRQKILDFLEDQLDSLFLNDDLTISYAGISDLFIHRYFKDLEIYYAKECLDQNDIHCKARQLIRERLVKVLSKYKDDDIILISHSMGSIIAYDVLTFLVPKIDIHTFITIGSPLGFPVVQGKIAAEWNVKKLIPAKLKAPSGIKKHWYNFADLHDKVALIYDLSKNYDANWRGIRPLNFVVNNDYQSEKDFNPHKSFGYLRTSEFSHVLLECIDYSKKGIYGKVNLLFRKNIKQYVSNLILRKCFLLF